MKHLLVRATAVVLVASAALSAACSSNDPMAPRAPSTARSPVHARGGSAGAEISGAPGARVGNGPTTGDPGTSSGYLITWGNHDQPAPPSGQQ